MGQMNHEILLELGIISESELRGTRKEINIVSWNKRMPKLDIREWGQDHEFIGKGTTFDIAEYFALRDFLNLHESIIIKLLDSAKISSNHNLLVK